MNRRHVLLHGSALLVALTSGSNIEAASQQRSAANGEALIDSALQCVKTGEICSAHCTTMLEQGDRAMAECQRRVDETVAVCEALASLAARGSPLVPRMAAIVHDACNACEKECLKHKEHAVCSACADACVACARECKRVMNDSPRDRRSVLVEQR